MEGLDKGGQGPTSGCCAIEEEEEEEEEEDEEEEEEEDSWHSFRLEVESTPGP
jgi:hypothetical protein